jgi:hypothetical protein
VVCVDIFECDDDNDIPETTSGWCDLKIVKKKKENKQIIMK